jgi:2-hydroxychromene-2-carboxylate isomerase
MPGRSSARSDPLRKNGEAMPKVEFHFDFGSPNAYLAHLVIPEIEQRTGAKFEYVPVLLGGVYKLTGNRSPAESLAGIKNKPQYERLETARFLKRHGIAHFRQNPFFPVNTLTIMRGAIAAQRLGVFERYVDEIYRHMWSEPKKLDDPVVLRAALIESGFDADRFAELVQDAGVKAQLLDNTERSVARGTFGSPTFFVGDEIFFGKDRLRDVEEMILTARTRRPANLDVMLKQFEQPDEARRFEKGKFEIVRIGGMTIGRATYEPGWKWSLHVGPAVGASSCPVEHVGIVVSGRATAAMDNGTIFEMRPGDLFHIAPGHDSWVVGDEPYVSLHFLGVEHYANHS